MRKTIAMTALAALFAAPLMMAPTEASASCQSRKTTGTLLGGVGGALIGNSISHGGGGAVIGGLGGAVVGHEIGKSGCNNRRAYYRSSTSSRSRYAAAPAPRPVRKVYYDQYGNPVASSPVYRSPHKPAAGIAGRRLSARGPEHEVQLHRRGPEPRRHRPERLQRAAQDGRKRQDLRGFQGA